MEGGVVMCFSLHSNLVAHSHTHISIDVQKDLLSKYSSGLFSAGGQAKTGDLLDKKTIGGSPNQYTHCHICAVCIVPPRKFLDQGIV